MRLKLTLTTALAAATTATAAPTNFKPRGISYDFNSTKLRGVNIGGWLVLEPFITPSIFERYSSDNSWVVDEWTLCQKLGKQGCYDALKPHWDNFVTRSDFEKIKGAGFDTVRIPIGYWAYYDVGEPYTSGADPYLEKAVDWARQTGLKVIIDIHGVPRSQNGFDHSGHKLQGPEWGQGDSMSQTHAALKFVNEKYAAPAMQDVVIAIEPVNEPLLSPQNLNMLKQFYRDFFNNLREVSDTAAMLHDGFWSPDWMNNFLTPWDNNSHHVIVDHHIYQVFNMDLVAMSPSEHRTLVCNSVDSYTHSDKWTIIGEWSGALTDCAKYLNGFRAGNRYEGTVSDSWYINSCAGKSGRVDTWSQEWKDDVRKYIETQLDAYEANTNGWIFWNFKTEGDAGDWDLFQLLDGGVFPQPIGDRRFGKHCTNF